MADYRTNFQKNTFRLWCPLAVSLLMLSLVTAQDVDSDGQWTLSDVATTLRMAGGRETPSLLADLDNDGLVTVRDLALAMRRVDGRDDKAILPDQGGLVAATDGAEVYFPPHFSPERIEATLKRIAEPQAGVVDERVEVSGEYLLELTGADPSGGEYWATVPLDRTRFPANPDQSMIIDGLVAEVFDPQTGSWRPTGDFSWFDEASGQFTFNAAWLDSGAGSPAGEDHPQGELRLKTTHQSRWKVQARTFSSRYAAGRQGSNFKLYFYMPDAGHADATMTDAEWNSTTGKASHPGVPDYIEDLDAALNSAYSELLALKSAQGGAVFDAQSTPMNVCVQDLGSASGSTSIGGGLFCDLYISNQKGEIGSWNRMLGVAAHEIVHVLQGKYFSIYSRARWFIEASANYYAARGAKFSEAERLKLYGGNDFADAHSYLSVPITTGADGSMYALAHFLDWLSSRYSRDIVADAFVQGKTSHLLNLGSAIQQAGGLGLTSAFGDYVDEIVTQPQGSLGVNGAIRINIGNASSKFLSSPNARLQYSTQFKQTYIAFKESLKPLSTALIRIQGRDDKPGLLVVDASGSQDFELEWLAYPFKQAEVPDFRQDPLSSGMSFSQLRSNSLAVDNFGWTTSRNGIEVFLANSGTASNVFAHVAFYLLLAPEILDLSSDSVAWSTAQAGNIPDSYIRGYNVYRNGSRVNGSGPIPHASQTSLLQPISNLASQDSVVVTVVDRFGNEWPKVDTPVVQEPEIRVLRVDGSDQGPAEVVRDEFSVHLEVTAYAEVTSLIYKFAGGGDVSILSGGNPGGGQPNTLTRDFSVSTQGLTEGTYTLSIRVEDAVGQSVERSFDVHYRPAAGPIVSVLEVNHKAQVPAEVFLDSFYVRYSASGDFPIVEVAYRLSGQPPVDVLTGGNSADLVSSFVVDASTVADGNHPLEIRAVDSEGQVGLDTVQVTLDRSGVSDVTVLQMMPDEGFERELFVLNNYGGFGGERGDSQVFFGGVPVEHWEQWTDRSIMGYVPDGARTGDVELVINGARADWKLDGVNTTKAGQFRVKPRQEAFPDEKFFRVYLSAPMKLDCDDSGTMIGGTPVCECLGCDDPENCTLDYWGWDGFHVAGVKVSNTGIPELPVSWSGTTFTAIGEGTFDNSAIEEYAWKMQASGKIEIGDLRPTLNGSASSETSKIREFDHIGSCSYRGWERSKEEVQLNGIQDLGDCPAGWTCDEPVLMSTGFSDSEDARSHIGAVYYVKEFEEAVEKYGEGWEGTPLRYRLTIREIDWSKAELNWSFFDSAP